jgi:hypothetical protein
MWKTANEFGEVELQTMARGFPKKEEMTLEWLRYYSTTRRPYRHLIVSRGRPTGFGAHVVIERRYLNLPARGMLKEVLDLRDEEGNSTMHYVCRWKEALDATGREFLTPKYLLVENKEGKTPLWCISWNRIEIPWERLPATKWTKHLNVLRSIIPLATWGVDEVGRRERKEKFIAKVEALTRVKEKEGIQIA